MSALCDQPAPTTGLHKHPTAEGGEGEGKSGRSGEEEEEEEEDLLAQSMEDEVGQLLRSTVQELETALQDSRKMLAERDEELVQTKAELERYKAQVAREIANKTKIAQSLDESLAYVREMEEVTQQWQLEVKESRQQSEKLKSHLLREQTRVRELETRLEETSQAKGKEISQLSSQLVEAREKLQSRGSGKGGRGTGGEEASGIDSMRFHFLKQAVYHLLTDFHAEDQLRAISSILEFSPQEKKAVYSKFAERRK